MNPCCCCTLRTGGIVIASIEVIGGVIATVLHALIVIEILHKDDKEGYDEDLKKNFNNGLHAIILGRQTQMDDDTSSIYKYAIAALTVFIIQIVVSSLLILGIAKKSILLMTIWLVEKVIFILIVDWMFLSSIFDSITVGEICFFLALLGLNAFYMNVIFSLRAQTKSKAGDKMPK